MPSTPEPTTPLGEPASVAGPVLLLGASGTIGQATLRALLRAGHEVVCLGRRAAPMPVEGAARVHQVVGDLSQASTWQRAASVSRVTTLVSCLASRNGAPADAWAVDHDMHLRALETATTHGVQHMVVLSALCVQKPKLAFQQAKLAFERQLIASGLRYSIVRPTAFFKSLSGQVARVQQGRAFVVFGDGRLTACKPIGDDDLGQFLALCIGQPAYWNRILPIGGPGPAITPLDQAQMLGHLLGRQVPIKHMPLWVMDAAVKLLGLTSRVIPAASAPAELARIGRYYASESMLVWDDIAKRYDERLTPSTGHQRLMDHYADLLAGRVHHDSGEHRVF